MSKQEEQIQAKLVRWFSEKYAKDHYGCLFEINNDTYSQNHAVKRKSMGMIAGAADLGFMPPDGIFSPIEIKALSTKHPVQHVKDQIVFCKTMIRHGGRALICYRLDHMKSFIQVLIEGRNKEAKVLQDSWLYHFEKLIEENGTRKTLLIQ